MSQATDTANGGSSMHLLSEWDILKFKMRVFPYVKFRCLCDDPVTRGMAQDLEQALVRAPTVLSHFLMPLK